ncbi:MAG: TRAP transporter large permease subunit [Planctomycetota bacterium]
MEVSVGKLFQGALLPGLVLVVCYLIYIEVRVRLQPQLVPAPASQAAPLQWSAVVTALLPPLLLLILVLGSILTGLATPTEAAGFGTLGALLAALLRRRLSWSALRGAGNQTVATSAMVFFIVAGAQLFSTAFVQLGGDRLIADVVLNLNLSGGAFILLILVLVFALGFILDFLEICFVIIPIVLTVMRHIGIAGEEQLLYFGLLLALMLQTSFLTPPFGFALFYLKGAAPATITTPDIYRGVLPFIVIQLAVLALVWAWPDLALGLPRLLAR